MPVYIDDARNPYGRMLMCHMIADTTEELYAMVDRIDVKRKWIQRKGTYQEHFDICITKREEAVKHGCVELTQKDLVRKIVARKR